ncbi:hypothetical protein Mp_1g22400 [Marchantia polymorpha subsp. ruderalis]|uniref:Large ribosomal subunit protein uL16m n=2 Tax=Marchantia polymorpha TaxID=3197 RepID=A0AAF6AT39_MARPO|nr:hypothetical protein MARPO_0118s0046 [Marchantia polymorpha]BBM99609.1 hypothetical protein Mp_1g22400 [Marchantia polymorpha subsp. ruderalis]|eukprot:PTQ30915.1 hypothetical protein MARPO_0118s0046 [Marchantia polymorpha]
MKPKEANRRTYATFTSKVIEGSVFTWTPNASMLERKHFSSMLEKCLFWGEFTDGRNIVKKPAEVRTGKGRGNTKGWIARVLKGQILFEIDCVCLSNDQQAATLAAHKLGLSIKFFKWS